VGLLTTNYSLQFRQIAFQCEGHIGGTVELRQNTWAAILWLMFSVLCFCGVSRGEEKVTFWQRLSVFSLEVAYKGGIISETTTQLISLLGWELNYISSPALLIIIILTYCNHRALIKLLINTCPRKFEVSLSLLYNKIPDPSLVFSTRVRTQYPECGILHNNWCQVCAGSCRPSPRAIDSILHVASSFWLAVRATPHISRVC
jgi:hypothetical protein